MASRCFFGDEERVGDVIDAIYAMTPEVFDGLLSEGLLQLPENVMRHLLDRDDANRGEVEVFMGLTLKETAYVYLWKADQVERQSSGAFSKTFLAAVVKGTNQRLALLCAAGQASDAAKALSEKLQRLVDPLGEVLLAEAAAEFSQPNQALPRARKRRRMIRTYSVGVLRELETDPGREELQVRARRSVTRTETKELVLTQKNFNKL